MHAEAIASQPTTTFILFTCIHTPIMICLQIVKQESLLLPPKVLFKLCLCIHLPVDHQLLGLEIMLDGAYPVGHFPSCPPQFSSPLLFRVFLL